MTKRTRISWQEGLYVDSEKIIYTSSPSWKIYKNDTQIWLFGAEESMHAGSKSNQIRVISLNAKNSGD